MRPGFARKTPMKGDRVRQSLLKHSNWRNRGERVKNTVNTERLRSITTVPVRSTSGYTARLSKHNTNSESGQQQPRRRCSLRSKRHNARGQKRSSRLFFTKRWKANDMRRALSRKE